MPVLDHLGITVDDLARGIAEFDPILSALGFAKHEIEGSVSWHREGESELILYPARLEGTGPHAHGRVGWQHLAFAVDSRDEVERMHAVAVEAGWTPVRDPKEYPRYTPTYYASFLENSDGIRIEFMRNPPSGSSAD